MTHKVEVTLLTEPLRRWARPLEGSDASSGGGVLQGNSSDCIGQHVHDDSTTPPAPKLNARPRWHSCLAMAAFVARPPKRLVGGRRAVRAAGAKRGLSVGPGVYFLLRNDALIYVGQSKNVAARMMGHASKKADDVWWLPVSVASLLAAESNFIALLLPALNKRIDEYPLDWVFTRRVEMGIATDAEKASLALPECFQVGDAPEVFGSELRRNRFLHADRFTTRGEAQRYLNQIRRRALRAEVSP